MANVKEVRRKAIKITLLDGIERTVKFTLNAMAELEERYGTVEKAFEELEANSVKALRAVLWAGFIEDDPDLTERQVGSLIDITYMSDLMESLNEAFSNDMPEVKGTELVAQKSAEVAQELSSEEDPN